MFHSLHQRETLLHLETALEGVEGTQGRGVQRARVAAPDRERRPRLAHDLWLWDAGIVSATLDLLPWQRLIKFNIMFRAGRSQLSCGKAVGRVWMRRRLQTARHGECRKS